MDIILANSSDLSHSFQHIIGFGVVVVALTLLWFVTEGIGAVLATRPEKALVRKTPTADESTFDDETVSEEEVAVIASTVACLIGASHRIVSIRSSNRDWSREGRREHFASHRIR